MIFQDSSDDKMVTEDTNHTNNGRAESESVPDSVAKSVLGSSKSGPNSADLLTDTAQSVLKCQLCGDVFEMQKLLNIHMNNYHREELPNEVSILGSYLSWTLSEVHVTKSSGVSVRTIQFFKMDSSRELTP